MLRIKQYLFCFLLYFIIGHAVLIAQQPELVLPNGHTEIVRTARFSPDGKYVLTGGADKVVNVWETFSGKKIRSLGGNKSDISYAFFSNDSKNIAVGTDSTVAIWSVPSYKLLGTFNLARKTFFSPDSRRVFLLGYNGIVKQVSIPSMSTENVYADNVIYDVAVSPDNRLICNAADSLLTIRDILTGKIISQKKINGFPLICFFTNNDGSLISVSNNGIQKLETKNQFADSLLSEGNIESAYLSKNNRFLLTCSDYLSSNVTLWDIDKYKPVFFSDTLRSRWDTIPVMDSDYRLLGFRTGTAAFAFPHLISSRGVIIANDGKYLGIPDIIWNCIDNSKSYQIKDNFLRRSDISPDNKYILIRLINEEIVFLWDLVAQKIVQSYTTTADKIRIADISPDGHKIVVAGEGNTLNICNLNSGTIDHVLKHKGRIAYAAFSRDGTKIMTNSFDSTAKIWDAESGVLLQNLPGQHPDFSPVYFSNNGQIVLSPLVSDSLKVYDENLVARDTTIAMYYNPALVLNAPNRNSHSGRYCLHTKKYTGELMLIDSLDKYSAKLLTGEEINAFSTDEKLLVLSDHNKMDTLLVWDIEAGKWILEIGIAMNSAGLTGRRGFTQLLFTPDDKYLLVADVNAVIHGLTTTGFKEVFTLPGQRCSISSNSKYLLVVNEGKCDVYDFEKRQILYSYIVVDSDNYLVFDSKKRFDGTEKARKMLYYSCGNEIIDLEQAKDQLWVPNLAERIMKGDSINAMTLDQLNICSLTPEVEDASSKADEYYFKITPRRGGLGEIILSVNGNPTKTYKPEQLKKKDGKYELSIKKAELNSYFITGAENQVTVKAYTSDNAISSRGLKINEAKTKQATTPPNLYAVMVGVSDYKGDELDLNYAAKDATDISATVANVAKKLLDTLDGKEHVFMYNLTTAKEHYLLPEKNSIKKTLEEIGKKATANDILLIFFAGHGVMKGLPAGEAGGKKQFYFLTADASKTSATDAVSDVGISTAELSEWMKPQNIKAQKRILIFDACNSGQAINDFVKMGKEDQGYIAARNDDKAQQIKAIDKLNEKSGLFILSASATDQSAYEMGRYSQGLLTYSLLKAIKQQPDILNQGKYLDVSRWFNAAKESVSDLAKESGERQEPQIVSNTNFNIGVVDEEVMAKIILPQEKPLFAASNFQNSDESADGDNLELSKLINLQLNEIAARGTESKIVYVTATNSPDAFTLSGRYDVKGNEVTIRVSVKRNNETKYRFEEKGTQDKLQELATTLVTKAAEWAAAGK